MYFCVFRCLKRLKDSVFLKFYGLLRADFYLIIETLKYYGRFDEEKERYCV